MAYTIGWLNINCKILATQGFDDNFHNLNILIRLGYLLNIIESGGKFSWFQIWRKILFSINFVVTHQVSYVSVYSKFFK
jgi:hypothetical protein